MSLWFAAPLALSVCLRGGQMFARNGTVTIRICDVWTLHDSLLGVPLYPRFRVFYRQTANAYAGLIMFSCVGRGTLQDGQ